MNRETCIRAFGVCWSLYAVACEAIGQPGTQVGWLKRSDILYRPDLKPKIEGFFIDFSQACGVAEREVSGKAQEILHLRFLRLLPEERVKQMTGVNENWKDLIEEIHVSAGEQMIRRGLWPPNKYFE